MRNPKSFYRHMTPEKAQEIRRRYFRRQATQRQLAEEYRLAQSSVSRIVSGYVWSSPVSRRGKVPMLGNLTVGDGARPGFERVR